MLATTSERTKKMGLTNFNENGLFLRTNKKSGNTLVEAMKKLGLTNFKEKCLICRAFEKS